MKHFTRSTILTVALASLAVDGAGGLMRSSAGHGRPPPSEDWPLPAAEKPDQASAEAGAAITSGRVAPSDWWRAAEVVRGVERTGVGEAAKLREAFETFRPIAFLADEEGAVCWRGARIQPAGAGAGAAHLRAVGSARGGCVQVGHHAADGHPRACTGDRALTFGGPRVRVADRPEMGRHVRQCTWAAAGRMVCGVRSTDSWLPLPSGVEPTVSGCRLRPLMGTMVDCNSEECPLFTQPCGGWPSRGDRRPTGQTTPHLRVSPHPGTFTVCCGAPSFQPRLAPWGANTKGSRHGFPHALPQGRPPRLVRAGAAERATDDPVAAESGRTADPQACARSHTRRPPCHERVKAFTSRQRVDGGSRGSSQLRLRNLRASTAPTSRPYRH
jgi:hypothetical protein